MKSLLAKAPLTGPMYFSSRESWKVQVMPSPRASTELGRNQGLDLLKLARHFTTCFNLLRSTLLVGPRKGKKGLSSRAKKRWRICMIFRISHPSLTDGESVREKPRSLHPPLIAHLGGEKVHKATTQQQQHRVLLTRQHHDAAPHVLTQAGAAKEKSHPGVPRSLVHSPPPSA